MSWAAVIIGGVSLVGSGIKYAQGRKQQRQAESMRPTDPGYQRNTALEDNARMLRERYGNYKLPGYDQALANINLAGTQAFSQGVQGATSSADVMDLASRIAYGQTQAQNQLAAQSAQGQDAALMDYLRANGIAGQEAVNENAWEREQYLRQQQQQADLYNAGQINQSSAISEGLSSLGQVAAYNMMQPNTNTTPANGIQTVRPGAEVVRRPPIQPVQTQGVTQISNPMPQQYALNGQPILNPIRLSRIRNVQPNYNLPYR